MNEQNRTSNYEQTGSTGTTDSVRQAAGEAVNTATTRVKETAGVVAEQAKQTAGSVADQAKQTIDQATRQTKDEISNVTGQVRRQADSLISEQKDMAADRLSTLASTLRESSRQLQDQNEGTMGRYADVIADQVESVSDFLRNRNAGDLLGDIQRLARQQPELFVAGSLAVGFLVGRFIKGPSRSALRESQDNPSYYGQGGYQSGYQGSGYQSSSYQGGAYGSGSYQSGSFGGSYQSSDFQSSGYQGGGYQGGYGSGSYRGSDNPAEGTAGRNQAERSDTEEYQGRYESSIQGNAFQQGGQESSGYQAEGADPDEERSHESGSYTEGYEGGKSAYQTGPTMTEGSDTDYPRYDPNFGGGKSGSSSSSESGKESSSGSSTESGNYTPSSRR